MKASDRTRLTSALRDHVASIAQDLRTRMLNPSLNSGEVREKARKLHGEEQIGEDFDVWTDLLSRRIAVLWVLKSVYVRVLEDRGLITPGRLLDPEAQQLFERLAPHLGETAFLRWIYRDLASKQGGLPELFSLQPAELALPSDECSRKLIAFWRHRDADTGTYWDFSSEHFDGELMGDLYQELDPVVKARFALCQTPDFVRSFMLDRTLTPAIENFGADQARLLDPSCGSGHLLIDGLKRLVTATQAQHPDWAPLKVVQQALERVVGIDINDYACGLARARLVMTAAELAGITTLAEAGSFHPHIYWADGLEQVEKEGLQAIQPSLFDEMEEKPRASFTRSDVRAALRKVFAKKFHAVVANPPYITEKDAGRKEYHREKTGKTQRYVSAYREYSLASPFTERCFQLAEKAGYVGLITSNNFMKREFGKPLIEKILAGLDLTLVVDTSQAYIPFHGTPTVMLFGRNQKPHGKAVRAVMGKRGESGVPEEPAKGRVWSSIVEGWNRLGFENEYVSVADVSRETLDKHPWSLGGGGAAELKEILGSRAASLLGKVVKSIGFMCITKQDDVFVQDRSVLYRRGCEEGWVKSFGMGDMVRDWGVCTGPVVVFPYDDRIELRKLHSAPGIMGYLWPFRRILEERAVFGGNTFRTAGRPWWEYGQIPKDRFISPLSIAFAFVATHNHFVLDRGGKVFKQSAPVIKLPAGATEDDHLALQGLLNSSTACFWMKQVFHAKGGVDRCLVEAWDMHFEFDSTKIKQFPLTEDTTQVKKYSAKLDALAMDRSLRSVGSILNEAGTWLNAGELLKVLQTRRKIDFDTFQHMVALQEELDWLCYSLYGLDNSTEIISPESVEPMLPTWLPWCISFARRDETNLAMIAKGDEPTEMPTVWFKRHGWEPVMDLPPTLSKTMRDRIEARLERTRSNPSLALIETANFKRRWYKPDYDTEEQEALRLWIADHLEATAKDHSRPFTLGQLTAALQDDARLLAVCEVLTGRQDFSLSTLLGEILQQDAVPSHRFHLYSENGLVKREAWERTWEDQRREDAGESVTPEVPPAYVIGDFLRTPYWQLRGKLDVPKERFIAFTEVPGRAGTDTLYGWAGWTPLQRLKAILVLDEDLEDEGLPMADRIALLDSAWRLLPDVAREDPAAATRLKAELQALSGMAGPSREQLDDWRKRFPPPGNRSGTRPDARSATRAAKKKPMALIGESSAEVGRLGL